MRTQRRPRGVRVSSGAHGRGGERGDPVLVPQRVQDGRVERRLEVRDVERVVLVRVRAKVLGLLERHLGLGLGLELGLGLRLGLGLGLGLG